METIPLDEVPLDILRAGSEVNVLVGSADPEMVELMFKVGPEDLAEDEVFIQADRDITWPQLLAALKCFPSTTQAKKNWCQGMKRKAEIRCGLEEVTIGKARRITIWVYKPFMEKDV